MIRYDQIKKATHLSVYPAKASYSFADPSITTFIVVVVTTTTS